MLPLELNQLDFDPITGTEHIHCSVADASANERLRAIREANGKVLKTFHLKSPMCSVRFTRTDDFQHGEDRGLYDKLTVDARKEFPKDNEHQFDLLVVEAQKAASSFGVSGLGPLLGKEAEQHFAARQEALTRLETLHANMLHDFERQREARDQEFQDKETRLTSSFDKRRADLEKEFQTRHIELGEKTKNIEEEKQRLDDRSSTHARRDLRQKLKDDLAQRHESFKLSRNTTIRRGAVMAMFVLVLLLFGGAAIYFFIQEVRNDGTFNPWNFGRQLAFSVTFLITSGFFIRWLNKWAQQHAEEEFKFHQLDIDIDRASWVVEMALEFQAEKGGNIPEELIDKLSANLFGAKSEHKDISLTPSEAVLNGLIDAAGSAKVTLPGGMEMSLDRKSFAALKNKLRRKATNHSFTPSPTDPTPPQTDRGS